jgi:hypothetical protein
MPIGASRLNNLTKYTSYGPSFSGTDANAGNLRLALPFNSVWGLDDVSHLYSGAVNTAACTRSGPSGTSVVISTAVSKFYGSSALGSNTGNAMIYTLPVNVVTGSPFLIEFWALTTQTSNQNNWIWADGYSARELAVGVFNIGGSPGDITVRNGGGRIGGTGTGWNHFAFSEASWWKNGARQGTPDYGASGWTFNQIRVGQQEAGDPNNYQGYMQDFRVYVGTNKYGTASFTPPGQIA